MAKVYVASSLDNWKSASHNIKLLKDAGHTITYDWTVHAEEYENDTSVAPTANRLRAIASKELQGVSSADCIVVILPGGNGTHFEFGVAYSLGIPVFLMDQRRSKGRKTSFHYLPNVIRISSISEFNDQINDERSN